MLLFLIDGLRYDQFGYELPAFHNVEMNGVRAEWMDGAFVSLSAPSMYTIATGKCTDPSRYPVYTSFRKVSACIHSLYLCLT